MIMIAKLNLHSVSIDFRLQISDFSVWLSDENNIAFNGGFPLLQIFYMRTPVNKTEAIYGRWS